MGDSCTGYGYIWLCGLGEREKFKMACCGDWFPMQRNLEKQTKLKGFRKKIS